MCVRYFSRDTVGTRSNLYAGEPVSHQTHQKGKRKKKVCYSAKVMGMMRCDSPIELLAESILIQLGGNRGKGGWGVGDEKDK